MGTPASAGTISVYMGDPLDITLTFENMDLRGYNHLAQIRASAVDGVVLTSFELSKTYNGTDTVFSFHLDGDSAAGADSITRLIGRSAVWDLQQYNTDGSASDTLVVGQLAMIPDVTRL